MLVVRLVGRVVQCGPIAANECVEGFVEEGGVRSRAVELPGPAEERLVHGCADPLARHGMTIA